MWEVERRLAFPPNAPRSLRSPSLRVSAASVTAANSAKGNVDGSGMGVVDKTRNAPRGSSTSTQSAGASRTPTGPTSPIKFVNQDISDIPSTDAASQ